MPFLHDGRKISQSTDLESNQKVPRKEDRSWRVSQLEMMWSTKPIKIRGAWLGGLGCETSVFGRNDARDTACRETRSGVSMRSSNKVIRSVGRSQRKRPLDV